MTDNGAQAAELVQLSQQNHCVLQVGHVERFNPVFRYLESVAKEPRFIETHRLSPYPARGIRRATRAAGPSGPPVKLPQIPANRCPGGQFIDLIAHPQGDADRGRLHQVVVNLLTDAAKYTPGAAGSG